MAFHEGDRVRTPMSVNGPVGSVRRESNTGTVVARWFTAEMSDVQMDETGIILPWRNDTLTLLPSANEEGGNDFPPQTFPV